MELKTVNQEIDELYKAGKFGEAYALAKSALESVEDQNVRLQLAWCSFRLNYADKQFAEAVASAELAGSIGIECRAHIAAVSGDAEELARLVSLAPDSPGIANAIITAARAADSTVSKSTVIDLAQRWGKSEHGVKGGHVQHNAGRFFLAKAAGSNDLEIAKSYLMGAIETYGTETNYNHRAAAWNWLAEVLEKLGLVTSALQASFESYGLWHHQCMLDPNNKGFGQNKQSARDRACRLARADLV